MGRIYKETDTDRDTDSEPNNKHTYQNAVRNHTERSAYWGWKGSFCEVSDCEVPRGFHDWKEGWEREAYSGQAPCPDSDPG